MWTNLYVMSAVIIAAATWLVSPRFQSSDPPSEVSRGFWSVVAGVLWPVVVVGALQLAAFRYVVQRLRSEPVEAAELPPPAELQDACSHS
ncbi:hypothetical protein Y900_011910 [Mycolicibacterium aromaticivorans JS19b1 = JCM 16368]|uniref:Uncharacterized protein n=1 Tax=Mycolicibacterium aromaticivorans JS19b1 = JCM 16368 TaxID=1440774 RepID=A0A064CH11_9MYCO|nr:hypothetical protein [Mycolicibacterium aromaticivorans]KDE99625.1 hypothetical protein Y900_011910 [Mycolicibacterium aromaticivorans JS19b1 = JCM 16368]